MISRVTDSKTFSVILIFSRIFVGALFIVSGMVKADDPLGFSYKLEEYFSESALGWTFFEPYALFMGILVSCGEIILGFAILFGGRPKLTIYLLLLLTVFFGFLTYYTAKCDPLATYKVIEAGKTIEKPVQCVTDCGCFGDAMKGTIGRSLTPWESFSKDMVLLFFVILLFIGKNKIQLNSKEQDRTILRDATIMLFLIAGYFFHWLFPVLYSLIGFALYKVFKKYHIKKIGAEWTIALVISIYAFGFAVYCYRYLPVKDFTPYAIGKSIPHGMKSAEELGLRPPQMAIEYKMKNIQTGKVETILSTEWLANAKWQNEKIWKLDGTGKNIELRSGYTAPIPAFAMELETDSGSVDIAYDIINNTSRPVFLLVMHDLSHADELSMPEINTIADFAKKNGMSFYAATSNSQEEINEFKKRNKCFYDFVVSDAQGILKPMVRANPGLLLLMNGEIVGKWHNNALPTNDEIIDLIKK